jgi:CSLREA domain-containing protein
MIGESMTYRVAYAPFFLALCILAILLAAVRLEAEPAATITVNNTGDATDAAPGDTVCETATGNNICTLRAAIQEANALAGDDMITIPAGHYHLALAGTGEDVAATGDLDIVDNLTISGAGSSSTFVDGSNLDRIFHVLTGTVGVIGLTIQHGAADFGGGVYALPNTTLAITNTVIYSNTATTSGGGLYNSGVLTLFNSVVDSNQVTGIDVGGGIASYGPLTIEQSRISNNAAPYGGGGIDASNHTAILNSTITGNKSLSYLGGGIRQTFQPITITNSTISYNIARAGGGIYSQNSASQMMITNSTISHNSATVFDGGGILTSGTIHLLNATVAYNSAVTGGDGIQRINSQVLLKNSIIANNETTNCSGGMTSAGNNLDSDNSCNLTATGDQPGQNPLFGVLQNNGGPTETHALLSGSPAIDTGSNIDCPATDQRGVVRPADGDGNTVPVCDIGAFEYVPIVYDNTIYLPIVPRS